MDQTTNNYIVSIGVVFREFIKLASRMLFEQDYDLF